MAPYDPLGAISALAQLMTTPTGQELLAAFLHGFGVDAEKLKNLASTLPVPEPPIEEKSDG